VGPKVGYLLPTRERVMQGKPAAVPLLQLAERAESLGFDSIWIGDSLIDRPRHEPLVMLAGVAGRTKRVSLGTGVLLPALRNPVQLAQQAAPSTRSARGGLSSALVSVRISLASTPNSPQSAYLSKNGSGGFSNACGCAVPSGPERRSVGMGAGSLRTR
jgi:Luciferase-like monooxygenase